MMLQQGTQAHHSPSLPGRPFFIGDDLNHVHLHAGTGISLLVRENRFEDLVNVRRHSLRVGPIAHTVQKFGRAVGIHAGTEENHQGVQVAVWDGAGCEAFGDFLQSGG